MAYLYKQRAENLWRQGVDLLEKDGVLLRTVEINDDALRKEFKGARQLVMQKFGSKEVKHRDETTKLRIFRRLSSQCRELVCQPVLSVHPTISIQIATKDLADVALAAHIAPFAKDTMKGLESQLKSAKKCMSVTGCYIDDLGLDNCIAIQHRPGSSRYASPTSAPQIKIINFVSGSTKCSMSADDVEKLWHSPNSVLLGSGVHGTTILVTLTDPDLIHMFAAKKLVLKASLREESKRHEEAMHLLLYNRMPRRCKQFICRPIRSSHPYISIQVAASQVQGNMNESTLQSKVQVRTVEHMLQESVKVRGEISEKLAKALMCLHSAGCLHNDFKLDNAIVVISKSAPLQVKIIDFGNSQCFKQHRHMLNANSVILAHRYGHRFPHINKYMRSLPSNGDGNFRNFHAVFPDSINVSKKRGSYIRQYLDYLQRGFSTHSIRPISHVYIGNMVSRDIRAASLIQDASRKRLLSASKPNSKKIVLQPRL